MNKKQKWERYLIRVPDDFEDALERFAGYEISTSKIVRFNRLMLPSKGKEMDKKMEQQMIGNKLKTLRNQKGWTQDMLAEYSGVSQAAISAIESGSNQNISLATAKKLAEALGVGIEHFTGNNNGNEVE